MTDSNGLTPMAQELAGIVGLEATLLLCEHFGGGRLHIPKVVSEMGSRLADIVGQANVVLLVRWYGGTDLSVPKLAARERMLRDQVIRDERRAGATVNELANRHCLTTRQIINICNMEAS